MMSYSSTNTVLVPAVLGATLNTTASSVTSVDKATPAVATYAQPDTSLLNVTRYVPSDPSCALAVASCPRARVPLVLTTAHDGAGVAAGRDAAWLGSTARITAPKATSPMPEASLFTGTTWCMRTD